MKFRTEMIIANSLPEVTKLFENQDNSQFWESNLLRRRSHSFDPNKSVNFYEVNGRVIEVSIQVVENNLPEVYSVYCEMQGAKQNVDHSFFAHSETETKWIMETEFLAEDLFLKLMITLLPNLVKKRSIIYAQEFKKYAEKMKSNNNYYCGDYI